MCLFLPLKIIDFDCKLLRLNESNIFTILNPYIPDRNKN